MERNTTRFNIDFYELSFLAEACIPPRPIARTSFWYDLQDKYYIQMTENERSQLHEWLSRNGNYDLNNEEVREFDCRYNPKNQYEITTEFKGDIKTQRAYLMNGEYHTNRRNSINKNYITETKPYIYES